MREDTIQAPEDLQKSKGKSTAKYVQYNFVSQEFSLERIH